jgi:beta-glucanase (GH16 family)
VWSDEFPGSTIDGTKWEHEVNCWGGGNGEQQCYVADAKNSFVTDGALHLVALNDNPSGAIGGPGNDPKVVTLPHSSARLRTKHLGDWTYGRFEANAKLPSGKGLWPAFWMLPTEEVYGGWASSGEIDIMEAVNLTPGANRVYGTIHYGAAWPGNVNTGAFYDPPTNVWDTFHTYAVEWEEGEIRWFVDDHHYATQVRWNTTASTFPAPFNQLFHLLLNVAVGGAWPGSPDAKTTFPQEMVVDWVRVYQCAADPATGHGCGTTDPAVKPL